MKYPEKRVMYLASEVPALSATFVYNEIFEFEKSVCPVEVASVHRPAAPANPEVLSRFEGRVFYLYGRSRGERLKSVAKMFVKHPLNFCRAGWALFLDILAVSVVSRTAAGMGFRFTYAALLGLEMERRGVDHLHVHFAHVPGDIAMYASLMTSIPFSVTGHANDIYERGWLLKQKAERSKFFSTISEFNERALVEKGCDPDKIKIVRCGIDQSEFNYRPPNAISNRTLRAGSLGRLVPKKGFHTLLDACSLLSARSVDFVLEIAGDGPLAESLQSQAKSLGIQDQVKFLGAMPHNQVSGWMHSLDVFALVCCEDESGDVDGIPVVLMEAMAIGAPVVTTRVSGLPELALHEKTGLIGEPKDAESIAELISRLADDELLRNALAQNAKSHVDAEFTLQANVEKLGKLIFSENASEI